MEEGVTYTNPNSLPTYYDQRLSIFCERYGSVFQDFTEIEKYDILAAIGTWGSYYAEFEQISLAEYLREFCPIGNDSDAYDMLVELSENYPEPREAMGLIAAVSSQITDRVWLRQES